MSPVIKISFKSWRRYRRSIKYFYTVSDDVVSDKMPSGPVDKNILGVLRKKDRRKILVGKVRASSYRG